MAKPTENIQQTSKSTWSSFHDILYLATFYNYIIIMIIICVTIIIVIVICIKDVVQRHRYCDHFVTMFACVWVRKLAQ